MIGRTNSAGVMPVGTINITENGTYSISSFSQAIVSVSGLVPSGTLEISSNGVYDVGIYASASVNVQSGGGQDVSELVNKTLSYYSGPMLGKLDGMYRVYVSANTFGSCSNLSYVNVTSIASSVTAGTPSTLYIGANAFGNCSTLSSFNLLDDVADPTKTYLSAMFVEAGAFYNCSKLSVKIVNAYSTSTSAFAHTGITAVEVNYSYGVYVGTDAFDNCTDLSEIHINAGTALTIRDGAFRNTGITKIDFSDFMCGSNYSVQFYQYCFQNCTQLSYASFSNMAAQTIQTSMFAGCTSLKSVYYSVTNNIGIGWINSRAFFNCTALESVEFYSVKSTMSIYDYCFYQCSALRQAPYASITNYVAQYAYLFAGIRSFVTSKMMTNIGRNAFGYAYFLYFSAAGVQTVNARAFTNCWNMSYVNLGSFSAIIPSSCFQSCNNLKSFLILNTPSIGGYSFDNCIRLESFYCFTSNVPTLNNTAFIYTGMNYSGALGHFGSIYVRASLLDSFKAATNWVQYSKRMVGLTDVEVEAIISAYNNVPYVEPEE